MSDQITNQPRPSAAESPSSVPKDPRRRPPLPLWTRATVIEITVCGVVVGVFLALLAAGFSRSFRIPSVLTAPLGFGLGALLGSLVALGAVRSRIGRGIRTVNRDLPRGAGPSPSPALPPLPRTEIAAKRDAIKLAAGLRPRHVSRLGGHHGPIHSVEITGDGRFALSAGEDNVVSLWDVQTGFELLACLGFQHAVHGVAFSPDGRLVAAVGQDVAGNGKAPQVQSIVRIWDAATAQEMRRFEIPGPLRALTFLPDGRHLLLAGHDFVRLWEIDGPSPVAMVDLRGGWFVMEMARSVAVSPDGDMALAGCDASQDARLINLDQGQVIRSLTGHRMGFPIYRRAAVVTVAFSPDGMRLLTGSLDQTARVWNLAGEELTRFEGHRGWWGWRGVVGVAWLDRQRVLSVSENGLLCVWDAESGAVLANHRHGAGVTSLAATPDGRLALTGGRDGVVRVWEF